MTQPDHDLLVIFGAGASFDSHPRVPPESAMTELPMPLDDDAAGALWWRPPLANQLFHDRYARVQSDYPHLLPLINRLRPTTTSGQGSWSLEGVLDRLSAEAGQTPVRHQQLLAVRFYLSHLLTKITRYWSGALFGTSNYASILDTIQHCTGAARVTLATFNYDSLLEIALALPTIDHQFKHLDDYFTAPKFSLIKLHGSTNWVQSVEGGPADLMRQGHVVPSKIIAAGAEIQVAARVEMADNHPSTHVVPALAIPRSTGKGFVCPRSHIAHLEGAVNRTRKVIVVGWRATDGHLLELVAKHQQTPWRFLIAQGNQSDARDVADRIKGAGVRLVDSDSALVDDGFSGLLTSDVLGSFLS